MPDRGRDGAAAGSHSPPAPLTPREVEIITRIALGATSRAATGRRDARVGTFAWTRSTGELRSCASSPSLLDLDADDDRPLLTRIVAHLQRDDIDRPRRRARRAISRRRGVGRCPLDDPRRGGSSPPGDGDACTRTGGRHRDRRGDRLTEMRPYRACPGGSSGGHGRAGRVARRRVHGLVGGLGSALAADAVAVRASRHADVRALATWKPSDTPASESTANASDVVVNCAAARPGGGRLRRWSRPASSS
jgi:hypothetical protein